MKPPRIPDDLMSGAAARAAAATQNEMFESVRNLRIPEPKIPRDSESGIGIEMRDRWDEDEDELVRKGE
jgi:F-box and WD-40 domain protein 1/11